MKYQSINTILIGVILLFGCQDSKPKPPKVTSDKTENTFDQSIKDIHTVLFKQQAAWNAGSIETFMQGYYNSPSLSFIGKSGVTSGWRQTLANYIKGYPDKEAMGELTFDVLETKMLSSDYCYMIGKFSLKREKDNPSGYFSLLWQKIDGSWVIVSDHTSS